MDRGREEPRREQRVGGTRLGGSILDCTRLIWETILSHNLVVKLLATTKLGRCFD